MENYPGRKPVLLDVDPFLTLSGNPGQEEVEGTGSEQVCPGRGARPGTGVRCPQEHEEGLQPAARAPTSGQALNRPRRSRAAAGL